MRRMLVIANQTATDQALLEAVAQRVAEEPGDVTVLVPATPVSEQDRAFNHAEHIPAQMGETAAVALARHRLERSVKALRSLGIQAAGEVANRDPVKAVEEALMVGTFDEVVVSTLPRRRSRWLSQDLPERLRRRFGLPVTHVEAPATVPAHGRRATRSTPRHVAGYHASHR